MQLMYDNNNYKYATFIINELELMDVSSAKASWSAIHSPASFNVISIAGIHFAH